MNQDKCIDRIHIENNTNVSPDKCRQQEHIVFDDEELLKRLDGDKAFMADLLCIFLEHTPEQLDQLEKCLTDSNMSDTERIAHTLKGSGANISAYALRDCALRIELLSKDKKQTEAMIALPTLRRIYKELHEHLQTFIPKRKYSKAT